MLLNSHSDVRTMSYVPIISLIAAPKIMLPPVIAAVEVFGRERNRYNGRDKVAAIGYVISSLARTLISMAGAGFLFAPFDLITDCRKHSVGKIALTTAAWTFTIAAIATTIALSIIFPPTSSVIIPGVVSAVVGTLLTASAAG